MERLEWPSKKSNQKWQGEATGELAVSRSVVVDWNRGLEPETKEKQIEVAVRAGLELEASSRIPSLAPNRLATLLHLYLMVNQGSYRVFNSWKGSLNLPSNFPDLEKVWKNSKKSWVFFFFLPSYNKCFISEMFSFRRLVYRASWKKLCFCVLKVSIDNLFDNRKSGKSNYCFGKKV